MRRFSRKETDEERQFKLLCRDLSTSADITGALEFYRKNWANVAPPDFPVFLIPQILELFTASIPYFVANMKETEPDFVFMRDCVNLFRATKQFDKTWLQVFGFVKNYVLVHCGELTEQSIEFSRDLFEDPSFEQTLCAPDFIGDVFDLFFVQVDGLISDLIIENCVVVSDKNYDFSAFYERVLSAFRNREVKNFEKSMHFIATVCSFLKDEKFIETFLSAVADDCLQLDSFGFIAKLLDTNLDVCWKFLERELQSPLMKKQVLNDLVTILYDRRNTSKGKEFNYTLFAPRISCILRQRVLAECVSVQDESQRIEFLLSVMPLWETGMKPVCFRCLLETVENVDDFMLSIVSKGSREQLASAVNSDENIEKTMSYILKQLTQEFPSWQTVISDVLYWANNNVSGSVSWLKTVTHVSHAQHLAKSFIELAKCETVCGLIWNSMAKMCISSTEFVEVLLSDRFEVLLLQLKSTESLDFLAALVCNGPYEAIDLFVESHPDIFAQFTEKQLRQMMMGLPQESDSYGILRIPSLCKVVQEYQLRTPFDKFVYGKFGIKYSKQKRLDYLSQTFDCTCEPSPEAVHAAMNTSLPQFPVYQFHFDMPHAIARVETEAAVSFWFYIEKVIGRTVIVSSSSGEISFDHDGLRVYDQDPIECPLREWHMITLNFSEPKSFLSIGGVFFDGVKIIQRGSMEYGAKTITFGSDSWSNGIWFLAPNVTINRFMLSKEQIDKLFECPPCYENQHESRIEKVEAGCKYAEYQGLLVFFEGFGGGEWLFNELREVGNEKDFWFLFKSAFALLAVNAIPRRFFINAMRHVISEHHEWFNDNKLVQAFKEDRHGLVELLCDFQLLTCRSFEFSFMPSLFSRDLPVSSLFYCILDCYSFFELNESTELNFVEAISVFIKKFPQYLPRVMLALVAIQGNHQTAEMLDEKIRERRQSTLCHLVLTYPDSLFENVSSERFLDFCCVLDHKSAYQLLNAMIQHSMNNPDYLNISTLRSNSIFLLSLLQDEDDLWFNFASLLKEQEVRLWHVSESDKFNPQKMKLVELILDLAAYSMNDKLKRNIHPGTELKVMRFVYDFVGMDLLKTIPDSIIHICSLGFDWEAPNPALTKSQSKLLNLKLKETVSPTRYSKLLKLDPEFTDTVVSKIEDEIELLEQEKDTTTEIPSNLQEIADSEEIGLMTKVLANALALKLKSFMLSEKKVFSLYTIISSDIPNEVSVIMHQKVVQRILELPKQALSDDAWSLLFDFLSKMVSANLWVSHEDTLAKLAVQRVNTRTKYGKGLLITCLEQCDCPVQVDLLRLFFSTPNFVELLEDQGFMTSIAKIVCQTDLVSEPGFADLLTLISSVCDGSDFAEAIKEGRLSDWYASIEEKPAKIQLGSPTQDWPAFPSDIIITRSVEFPFNTAIKSAEAGLVYLGLRRQFFYRLTKSNQEIEEVIGQMFRQKAKTHALHNDATEFMVVEAPQPFTVPQKMVPLVYKFTPPATRASRTLTIPHSIHQASFESPIRELNRSRTAPMCLEHWNLPTYLDCSVTSVLKEIIGTNLKNCWLMSTIEELPCVYSLGKDSFDFVMNASYSSDEDCVVLNGLSPMLCHFAAFEIPMHGYYGSFRQFCHRAIISFKYSDVVLTINRRYAYRPTMLDVFLVNGVHQTLNFTSEYDRKAFLYKVRADKKPAPCGVYYASQFLSKPLDTVTKMWQRREIGNFDYTIFLNIASGRSFNDLSQYPVVPWILGGFTKDTVEHTRDMSKPMGAQTAERAKRYINNFQETEYHYGTHYSHSAAVLHYMLRMEPYTLYGLHLHNGWDHKDRLFCSIAESWRSASEANQADVKELIPEFYCFPSMFENVNHLQLRERSDGQSLNTVTLPKWAKNAEHFVWVMRTAFDDEEHLNEWIDLIFGYKQRGEAAVNAVNIFHPLAYSDSFKEDEYDEQDRKAAIDTILNFGQCPLQLFTSEHPARELAVSRMTLAEQCELRTTELAPVQPLPRFSYVSEESIVDCYDTEIVYDFPSKKESLDSSVVSFCLSSDRTMYAVSRPNFTVKIHTAGGVITTVLTRTRTATHMALSSQHAILATTDENQLFLFDVTTGILMRRTTAPDTIIGVEFDESAGFVVVATKTSLIVFGLDLRSIASEHSTSEISCFSTGDSLIWDKIPSYFTGHTDGSISRWSLDVAASTLTQSSLVSAGEFPVHLIYAFADSQALLCTYTNGRRFLYTVPVTNKRILKLQHFPSCSVCNAPKSAYYCCSQCGLWICANCRATRGPVICQICNPGDSPSTQNA